MARKWADWLHHPERVGDHQRLGAGDKKQVAHKWAGCLHHPCHLTRPQLPRAEDKIRSSLQVGGLATSPLPSRGSHKHQILISKSPRMQLIVVLWHNAMDECGKLLPRQPTPQGYIYRQWNPKRTPNSKTLSHRPTLQPYDPTTHHRQTRPTAMQTAAAIDRDKHTKKTKGHKG